jgi:putative NADH-flavin reductase
MQDKELKTLVVGASGGAGRLLVKQLLDRGHAVRVIVRQQASLPEDLLAHERLTVVRGNLLELSDAQLADAAEGCQAIASCLGHNMSWQGLFGPPYRLVTDAVRRLCAAVKARQTATPVRFVLMNSAGNRNLDEPISAAQALVIGLLRLLVQPHADNERAADYLRTRIGQSDESIQWAAVRPDSLIDEDAMSGYALHPSPTRSAIFDAGATSRINVAHCMASLMVEDALWAKWRGKMPVIYNTGSIPA